MVMLAGIIVTAIFFWTEWNAELNRLKTQFKQDAEIRANLVVEHLDGCLFVVQAIQSSLKGSNRLDNTVFKIFTAPFLAERKEIQALAWLPCVLQSQRADFEKRVRQEGLPGFQINDLTPDGRLISADKREEYYPVEYIEPLKGNELKTGFNMALEPIRRAALEQARDTGKAAITERIEMVQEDKAFGFLVYLPLYQEGMPATTVDERRAALKGFVVGMFRLSDAMEAAMNIVVPEGLSFDLVDLSAPPRRQQLYHWTARVKVIESWKSPLYPPSPKYVRREVFGGRQWEMSITANSTYVARHFSLIQWLIPPTGFVLTLLLGLYLRTIHSQRTILERTVLERTAELRKYQENLEGLVQERAAELSQTNEMLKKEVADRRQADESLRQSEEKLRLLLNSTAEAIYGVDLKGNCTFCNPACLQLIGCKHEEELLGKNMHWLIHHSRADGTPYPIEESRIFQAFAKEEGIHADDEVLWRANGTCFPAEYWAYPQRIGGVVVGAVVTFVDISERKKMEETLRESEQRHRLFAANVSDVIWTMDFTGKFTYMNPSIVRFLGFTPEETVQVIYKDMITPSSLDLANMKFEECVAMAKANQQTESDFFELEFFRKDGSTVWGESTISCIFEPSGKVIGFQGVTRDITKRRQAQEALRSSEERLRTMYERSNDAIMLATEKGFFDCNPRTLEMFGYESKEEFTKLHPADVSPPTQPDGEASLSAAQERMQTAFRKGINHFEWVHRRKNGQDFPAEVLLSAFDYGGRRVLQATVRDINQRKRAEIELKKLSVAVEQNPATIVITDREGNIEYVNPKFCRITGYTFDEVRGKNPRILKSEKKTPEEYKNLWDTILSGREWRGEFYNKKKNGEYYWEQALISPIIDDKGRITNFIAIKEDITDRKRAEEALKNALNDLAKTNLELKKASEVKSRFLATMSHEIRTPLNAIIGMTGLLLDTKLDAEQEDCAETVRTSGEMLLALINNILDFSKIEAEKIDLESQPFDLRRCVEESLDLVNQRADEKKLEIGYQMQEDLPLFFVGDVTRLRQILVNLLGSRVVAGKIANVDGPSGVVRTSFQLAVGGHGRSRRTGHQLERRRKHRPGENPGQTIGRDLAVCEFGGTGT